MTMSRVTLQDMLQARDWRREQQQRMLKQHGSSLISFTINMPGDVKDCYASRVAFDRGLKAVQTLLRKKDWQCLDTLTEQKATGPLALMALAQPDATAVKQAMIELENEHPLGRLFDLDVLDRDGRILSRKEFGAPVRKCLLCDLDAVICARSQQHDIQQLRAHIHELVVLQQATVDE